MDFQRLVVLTPRLANTVLRLAAMLAKFAVLFLLARHLPAQDLATYGLLAAGVGYCAYLIGLEFHSFAAREYQKSSHAALGGLIRDQFFLYLLLYVPLYLTAGFLVLFEAQWLIPWTTIILLISVEHVGIELSRAFVALKKPFFASVLLFLRAAVLPLAVYIIKEVSGEQLTVLTVTNTWLLCSSFALLVGILLILLANYGSWLRPVNWTWLAEGLKVTAYFLVASLCLRGIYIFDRYWLAEYLTHEIVASYIFFMSVFTAGISFLDAAVFSFLYPSLIGYWQNKDPLAYRKATAKFALQTLVVGILFLICTRLLITPLLNLVSQPYLSENVNIYHSLEPAMLFYFLSMIPHYALYAQGKERHILQSQVFSFAFFLIYLLAHGSSISYEPLTDALLLSFLGLFLWKSTIYLIVTPRAYMALTK